MLMGISSITIPQLSSMFLSRLTSPPIITLITRPPANKPLLKLPLLEPNAGEPKHADMRLEYASFLNGRSKLIITLARSGDSPNVCDGREASVITNTWDLNVLASASRAFSSSVCSILS
ncbi:hypothetical protein Mapa_009793 [Marchantia paleacea]|nr:hypothetical protein Mapa_009793 [Marchantia paleacea]